MTDKLKGVLIAMAAVIALAAGGVAIAGATGGDDENGRDDNGTERAITGPALDRASRVALDQVGGGKVTGTEVGDEEGYYEVEVTKPDGSQVDVHLNRDFSPAGTESDGHADDS
jgi:uncharacterized membrane protein YkoI